MEVFDRKGRPVALVEPALAKGGEGGVHEVAGHPQTIAKVYHDDALAASRQEKIEAMARMAGGIDVAGRIAWPRQPLYADAGQRRFVGFAMERMRTTRSIGDLYEYPGANVSMLDKIHVAQSLAQATAAVHAAGQVIGDYNDNNILVTKGPRAVLVDADSFHVSAGGTTWPCSVCMPGYEAPEVLRAVRGHASYAEAAAAGVATFTEHSDNWALAVHIHRMLFNGVHPYHCAAVVTPGGSLPAPLPTSKRVERGETPFYKKVAGARVAPFAPEPSMLPDYLRALFERAFVAGHRDPALRPSAGEWLAGLLRYEGELVACTKNSAHYYGSHLQKCPYCAADRRVARATAAPHAAAVTKTASTSTKRAASTSKGKPAKSHRLLGMLAPRPYWDTRDWVVAIAVALLLANAFLQTPVFLALVEVAPLEGEADLAFVAPLAGALLGTFVFCHFAAREERPGTFALAGLSALAGMALLTPLYAVVQIALLAAVVVGFIALIYS